MSYLNSTDLTRNRFTTRIKTKREFTTVTSRTLPDHLVAERYPAYVWGGLLASVWKTNQTPLDPAGIRAPLVQCRLRLSVTSSAASQRQVPTLPEATHRPTPHWESPNAPSLARKTLISGVRWTVEPEMGQLARFHNTPAVRATQVDGTSCKEVWDGVVARELFFEIQSVEEGIDGDHGLPVGTEARRETPEAVTVFLSHCGVRASVLSEKEQILNLIWTCVQLWTKDNCRRIACIVDNRCAFQHSSSRGDCNFDARRVS